MKERFRNAATGGCTCPPGMPCVCGATPLVRELRPLKRRPSAAERAANPRADSAVLRAVERLPDDGPRGELMATVPAPSADRAAPPRTRAAA